MIFGQIAELLAGLPCQMFVVRFDKRWVTKDGQTTPDHLYGWAFRALLDTLHDFLDASGEHGMLLMDARSDLHSTVQDGRIVDA